MDTGLKTAHWRIIELECSIVQHRLFIKEPAIDPLEWDPFCRSTGSNLEVAIPFDLEFEAIADVSHSVDLGTNIRVTGGGDPECPMVLKWPAIENQ